MKELNNIQMTTVSGGYTLYDTKLTGSFELSNLSEACQAALKNVSYHAEPRIVWVLDFKRTLPQCSDQDTHAILKQLIQGI